MMILYYFIKHEARVSHENFSKSFHNVDDKQFAHN